MHDPSESAIAAGWSAADAAAPRATVDHFAALLARHPGSARALFEYAGALDFADRPAEAAAGYERAFAAGLSGDLLRQGLIQYASTLRNLGRPSEALTVLGTAHELFGDDDAVIAFRSLVLSDLGRGGEAVAALLNLTLDKMDSPSLWQYRRPLRGYANTLTTKAHQDS